MSTLAADRPLVSGTGSPYSVVRGCRRDGPGCSLEVESPARERTSLRIACPPDRQAVADLRARGLRPLAVRIDLTDSTVSGCSVVVASADGPRRTPIPLSAALGLCADGLHAVVIRLP